MWLQSATVRPLNRWPTNGMPTNRLRTTNRRGHIRELDHTCITWLQQIRRLQLKQLRPFLHLSLAFPCRKRKVSGPSLAQFPIKIYIHHHKWCHLPARSFFISSVMISVTTPSAAASPASVNFSSSVLLAAAISASPPSSWIKKNRK